MGKLIWSFTLVFFLTTSSEAGTKVARISEPDMDISKPMVIRMTAGRATVVDFPCEVLPTILGLTNDIVAKVGPDSLKTLTLWVHSDVSQSTNMIVKCEGEVFVFDILPNRQNHQDYINIQHSYDGRRRATRTLIASSKTRIKPTKRKLIASSKDASSPEWKKELILEALNRDSHPKKLIGKGKKK